MDPGGISESGVTNRKAGRAGERGKEPENKPTRARRREPTEARQMGGSPERRRPVISVLTLWTPACRCGTKHRTLRAARPSCSRLGSASCLPPPMPPEPGQGPSPAAAPAVRAGQATRKEQQGTHRAEGSWRTGSPGDCRRHGTRLGSSGAGPAPTHPASEHEGGSPDPAGAIPAGQAPAPTPPATQRSER